MKKKNLSFWVYLIAYLVLTIACIAYFLIEYFIYEADFVQVVIPFVYAVITIVFVPVIIFSYRHYYFKRKRIEEIQRLYNIQSTFNNKTLFADEISKKVKRSKSQGVILSLMVFSDSEKFQYYQLEKIRTFYGVVIKYFETLMENPRYKKTLSCGFEQHTFYLYYQYETKDEVNRFISKVDNDLYTLFAKTDVPINMHPSFGVYQIEDKKKNILDMIDNSTLALRISVNSFQVAVFYDDDILNSQINNDALEQEIRRGIEKHEFEVYYQGKFDLATNKFVGAEALIRWNHPTRGLFNPGAFIGECEKSGLIHVLDFYVFDQVCKDLGDWKSRGRKLIPISTNFSSSDFYRPDFVESVLTTIEANHIAPNYVELEITESSTANNYFYVMSVLKRLKESNVRILMDDFGTGFSSLGNLKKYPINALKIDKSFIDDITTDVKSREIVGTIINLSRSLGLTSVAEGVQTEKQVNVLRELKCNQIQGFYYCKPMPKKDFEIFLSTNVFEKKEDIL